MDDDYKTVCPVCASPAAETDDDGWIFCHECGRMTDDKGVSYDASEYLLD